MPGNHPPPPLGSVPPKPVVSRKAEDHDPSGEISSRYVAVHGPPVVQTISKKAKARLNQSGGGGGPPQKRGEGGTRGGNIGGAGIEPIGGSGPSHKKGEGAGCGSGGPSQKKGGGRRGGPPPLGPSSETARPRSWGVAERRDPHEPSMRPPRELGRDGPRGASTYRPGYDNTNDFQAHTANDRHQRWPREGPGYTYRGNPIGGPARKIPPDGRAAHERWPSDPRGAHEPQTGYRSWSDNPASIPVRHDTWRPSPSPPLPVQPISANRYPLGRPGLNTGVPEAVPSFTAPPPSAAVQQERLPVQSLSPVAVQNPNPSPPPQSKLKFKPNKPPPKPTPVEPVNLAEEVQDVKPSITATEKPRVSDAKTPKHGGQGQVSGSDGWSADPNASSGVWSISITDLPGNCFVAEKSVRTGHRRAVKRIYTLDLEKSGRKVTRVLWREDGVGFEWERHSSPDTTTDFPRPPGAGPLPTIERAPHKSKIKMSVKPGSLSIAPRPVHAEPANAPSATTAAHTPPVPGPSGLSGPSISRSTAKPADLLIPVSASAHNLLPAARVRDNRSASPGVQALPPTTTTSSTSQARPRSDRISPNASLLDELQGTLFQKLRNIDNWTELLKDFPNQADTLTRQIERTQEEIFGIQSAIRAEKRRSGGR